MNEDIKIFNNDCFNIFPDIPPKSINCVIVDLPYNQTSCKWDCAIDLDKMWIELKRICQKNCNYIFFCTTKFGYELIKSNEKWFRYDLVWKKSRKVGFLSANKMPLRQHEMIYIFGDNNTDDLELERNKELREYAERIYLKIGKSRKEIFKLMGDTTLDHFFRFSSSQFGLPTKETYNKMIKIFNLEEKDNYEDLKDKWESQGDTKKYNPQKTPGKPYKTRRDGEVEIYGSKLAYTTENKTGERHPSSVLEHEMVYVFGDNNHKKGAYNPQKTPGKPYKTGDIKNKDNVYRISRKGQIVNGRHPSSVLEHEMVYIFGENEEKPWDLPKEKYKELKDYSKYLLSNLKITDKKLKNIRFFKYDKKDFCLMRKPTYQKLIDNYKINELDGFKTFDELKTLWNKEKKQIKSNRIYNSQKTKGKPYKTSKRNIGVYGDTIDGYENKDGTRHPSSVLEHEMVYIFGDNNHKKGPYNPQMELREKARIRTNPEKRKVNNVYGEQEVSLSSIHTHRHPTSVIENTVLEYKNPHKTVHSTQKPVNLCEFLVKSYSNEGDVILDFTMGSGTTGIACKNTKRKFIGIEKDKKIYEVALKRLSG